MRLVLIFILIHLAIGSAWSQEAENVTMSKVNKAINNLKSQGISNIGYKKDYCEGAVPISVKSKIDGHLTYPCNYHCTLYLFWQQGAKEYIRKYDACGESQALSVDSKELFEYPDRYFNIMKREKIKPFSAWSSDHGDRSDILLFNKEDSLFKNLNLYDLRETDYDKTKNQSYSENKKLKFVQWEERLSAIIRKLEDEKKFKTSN